MSNARKILSISFIILMLDLSILMGLFFYKFTRSSKYMKLDEYIEQYKEIDFKLVNSYRNLNFDIPNKNLFLPRTIDRYCAIDGINLSLVDKELITIRKIIEYEDRNHIDLYIEYITDNFKTKNMKELYIDSNIEIHSDNFEKNNPKLEKIYFNDKSFLNGRVLSTISHKKLYYIDKNCMELYGKEFNLTKQDFECLYTNVIYNINNTETWYGIDVDDDNLPMNLYVNGADRYYIIKSSNYTWYLDEDYTIPFDTNTIIKKEYYTDGNGDLIYNYHPLKLYGKH